MSGRYIPDVGDIVWINFTPQSGHEQAGRRPAVVLSPKNYNIRAGLLVCVPVTCQIKGYPLEVVLSGSDVTGAALADQVKSIDWESRGAERKGKRASSKVPRLSPAVTKPTPFGKSGNCFR